MTTRRTPAFMQTTPPSRRRPCPGKPAPALPLLSG